MGGAVALMAIEKAPEIRAVISESSYASLSEMAFELLRIPVLNYPIAYLVGLWAKLFLGIDVRDASPADRIRNTTIPILLIHSSADAVIPFSHARLLQQALAKNPNAEFWFHDDFAHGQLASDYRTRIKDFFLKHLSENSPLNEGRNGPHNKNVCSQLLHLAILFRLFQDRLKPAETTKKNTAHEKAERVQPHSVPALQMASERIEPLVLWRLRLPGVLLRWLRHGLEYVYDPRALPRLRLTSGAGRSA